MGEYHFSTFSPTLVKSVSLTVAVLMDVKLYIIAGLICISSMVNVEHLFMYLLAREFLLAEPSKSPLHMICRYVLPFCGLSSRFLLVYLEARSFLF